MIMMMANNRDSDYDYDMVWFNGMVEPFNQNGLMRWFMIWLLI